MEGSAPMTRKAPDPVRQHGGAGAPWFEAASPGLLTNRTARNFLMSYTEAQYAEVVKLLTIQGICSLAQTHGPRVLPLAELREAVAHAQAALTLEEHIPEVAGKLANTDQPELADAFLAFMLSDGFQSVIPETNWMYPAVLPEGGLADGFDGLVTPDTALLYPADEADAVREAAMQKWLAALAR